MSIDLSNLPDDVLSYTNDRLYTFVEESLGHDEMMVIKIQSINNVRALINVPDIMAFFNFNSKEINALKERVCFVDEDKKLFLVEAGIKANIANLVLLLKEKANKETKRAKNRKPSSTSLQTSTQANNNQSILSTSNLSDVTIINSQLTPVISTTPELNSPNYYIHKICENIDNYCVNTFNNITLTNDVDYKIFMNVLNPSIDGTITCGCKTNIKLIFRSKSNAFQLSAYFKHIKKSRCIMMKKKRQGLNNVSNVNKSLLDVASQENNTSTASNIQNVPDEEIVDDGDESSQMVINDSITTVSNSHGRKRSLQSRSTSSITKKKTNHYSE
ncbi:unnamed protein product [Adineta ricciae]|uniref:Uncharacterized protein n=1 Tax=Adineta ricciae TaxID=249248 RepID=A0A814XA69_ADIRI|nr:unnamed protein product [Adineta ricciae]CAF1441508.1 unnamed protein product [Adineta ricciae]